MNNQEILEKAIQKAIDGGWSIGNLNAKEDYSFAPLVNARKVNAFRINKSAPTVNDIIFNHDFAKALWGEEDEIVWADDQRMVTLPKYKFHLQEMAIAEDPIKYLGGTI